ncbi:Oidioi.mRNA.OKI2018_I69.chr2.g6157.t1.cds [Oikopleura dioica]|uniref:Oidioi.mRNA.OKI2018_I69.chr2.g6157.t1.cds n=1 Tax=Oikopleura dioica TaxID=34765 RepID=A0ABN7T877_OIKDI|nr:Oidioi.mRNA.OKI2018_I69.chr2.g6157.t1.cds [Oikopleura dioica]
MFQANSRKNLATYNTGIKCNCLKSRTCSNPICKKKQIFIDDLLDDGFYIVCDLARAAKSKPPAIVEALMHEFRPAKHTSGEEISSDEDEFAVPREMDPWLAAKVEDFYRLQKRKAAKE